MRATAFENFDSKTDIDKIITIFKTKKIIILVFYI